METAVEKLVSADEIRDELVEKIVRRLTAMKPVGERCTCHPPARTDAAEHDPPCAGFWYQRAIDVVRGVRDEL